MTRLSDQQMKNLGLMELTVKPKKNKYNAKKTEVDGITFDSAKEARKYAELRLLQRAGEVTEIELQPKFTLLPGFRYRGKKIQGVTYTADFLVTYKDGSRQIVETKGYKTRDYILRKKLLLRKIKDDAEIEFIEE